MPSDDQQASLFWYCLTKMCDQVLSFLGVSQRTVWVFFTAGPDLCHLSGLRAPRPDSDGNTTYFREQLRSRPRLGNVDDPIAKATDRIPFTRRHRGRRPLPSVGARCVRSVPSAVPSLAVDASNATVVTATIASTHRGLCCAWHWKRVQATT